jgi:hypothetical protein
MYRKITVFSSGRKHFLIEYAFGLNVAWGEKCE